LLHLAAVLGHETLFEYLACLPDAASSLLPLRDQNGLTAVDLAVVYGKNPLQELLRGYHLRILDQMPSDRIHNLLERGMRKRYRVLSFLEKIFLFAKYCVRQLAQMNYSRLKKMLWRRFNSDLAIQRYYLRTFEQSLYPSLPPKPKLEENLIVGLVRGRMNSLYTSYQKYKPFAGWRARDLMVWYSWVPVLFAAVLVQLMIPSSSSNTIKPTIDQARNFVTA